MPGIGSQACPKPPSRFDTKRQAQQAKEAHWRAVCKIVDTRDGQHCRVCGTWTNPEAITLLERGHRHHLKYRSAGGPDEAWNVALTCAKCHADEHAGRIQLSGDASQRDPVTGQGRGVADALRQREGTERRASTAPDASDGTRRAEVSGKAGRQSEHKTGASQ